MQGLRGLQGFKIRPLSFTRFAGLAMIASPAEIASLANMATCCCHCTVCKDRDVCNAYNYVVALTGSQRLQGLRAAIALVHY